MTTAITPITITPTAAQIAHAELNGWDPQRKHSKAQLLKMVLDAGTQGLHHPSTWTKPELAGEVEHLEWIRREQAQAQQA